jgi:hypothetical protein
VIILEEVTVAWDNDSSNVEVSEVSVNVSRGRG